MKHYLNYFGFFTLVILMVIAISSHTKTLFINMFKHLKSVLLLCSIVVIFFGCCCGCKLKPQLSKPDTSALTPVIDTAAKPYTDSIAVKPMAQHRRLTLNRKVHLVKEPAVKHLGVIDKSAFKSTALLTSKMPFVMGEAGTITYAGTSLDSGFLINDSPITVGTIVFTTLYPNWRITYNIAAKTDTLHLNFNRIIKLNDSTLVVK